MMKYILTFTLLITLAVSGTAQAQRSDSIAAVVNGDVITYTDLYDRLDLIIKSSGMPNNEQFKEKLLPQVLTGLITEQIQLQEARRLNIPIGDDAIEAGFAELAGQNNMKPEQFKKVLDAQNVSMDTIQKQIRSQMAWKNVVQQQIRPRVVLTDDDIDAEIERLQDREGEEEYFIAEIFLPVDDSVNESEVRRAASDLAGQLSNDLSKFPEAARQFSQSATAAKGGLIGWITPDQLDSAIANTLVTMDPQSVSDPIKTDEGYTIIFMREKRVINLGGGNDEPTLRIKTAVFELPEGERERRAVQDDVETFTRDVKGCLDISKQISRRQNASLREYEDIADAIPSNIVSAVKNSTIGDPGDTIKTDNVIVVPMLCGREGGGENIALQREIENRLGTQRLDVLQKRYLRDLIADAYIERRV